MFGSMLKHLSDDYRNFIIQNFELIPHLVKMLQDETS